MPRADLLRFFRDPAGFARDVPPGTADLWRAALETVARPALATRSNGPRLRDAQVAAWRGIGDLRAALVLGPPGTGKTFALSWMALAYAEARRRQGLRARILLTGFTRASIANLLQAVHEKLGFVGNAGIRVAWHGHEPPPGLPGGVEIASDASVLQADHLILGCTSWALYRLIDGARLPSADGPTASIFDLVCIDEASQMVVGQGLMSLAGLAPDGRVLVAGDDQQLPPVRAVHDHEIDGRRIGGSLYDFLVEAGVPEFPLDETFRLNRPLAEFPGQQFYDGRLQAVFPDRRLELREGWEAGLEDWEREALHPDRPVCILLHEGPSAGTENPLEAALVTRLASRLRERMTPVSGDTLRDEDFWGQRLAIVTPHRAQNAAIRAALRAARLDRSSLVETVDRIQGGERDAILASYTVSDTEFAQSEAEFIFSPHRFNVTITRARTKLILVISRRLLETVPADEDVFDSARLLRDFVFESEDRGRVMVRAADGNVWPVTVRVRRFDDSEPLPRLEPVVDSRSDTEPLPEFTAELQDLLEAIRALATASPYGSATLPAIRQRIARAIEIADLRALACLGRVEIHQRLGPYGTFLTVHPIDPSRPAIPARRETVRERIEEAIQGARRGPNAPFYDNVRARFDWVGTQEEDRLAPILDELVAEGLVRWGEFRRKRTIESTADTRLAEQDVPPPADALSDEDFELLNRLEDRETRLINFGVFEHWATPRDLAALAQWGEASVSASLRRLADHGFILISDGGRVRSRAAELAREVRYVKQRFRQGDAQRRPFLVRALRLELKDRDKPERDQALSEIEAEVTRRLENVSGASAVVSGIATMLRRAWNDADPRLAGFQRRALETMLPAWLGLTDADAFVVTAETGTGKTEAALVPMIAGAALDRLRGTQGTRAVLVYPRIRLAANQAQRIARYLSALAAVDGMPLLRTGMQSEDIPTHFADGGFNEEIWQRLDADVFAFPLFACPESACGGPLHLLPGQGQAGADRVRCTVCSWSYDGWVGSKEAVRASPPDFFIPITESLHHWLNDPRAGRVFGDDQDLATPRAVLADEIHLYSHVHGAQVGYALRRLIARADLNRRPREGCASPTLAIGMSATLAQPSAFWGALCGRTRVLTIRPEAEERRPNPRGREYFYFIQPEVESRGRDIAGASTTIQSLMCLAHGTRRRTGRDGGYRGIVFLDSIDKLKRLHGDYRDAEEFQRLAQLRTRLFDDDPATGRPRRDCCRTPEACDRFREGECWYFAATDGRQRTVAGLYRPGRPLKVSERPVFSRGGGKADELIQQSDLVFSTSSLEVGFDDPHMMLVYQHYAPLNLASFVQRKGRGGRGADDRPVTAVTLSAYSPRDSWHFRRPRSMIDARSFAVPLNVENYFVCRGHVAAFLLDLLARQQRCQGASTPQIGPGFWLGADRLVRETFGSDIYRRLEVASLEAFWTQATRGTDLARLSRLDRWKQNLPWIPGRLFQSINLPLLRVRYPRDAATFDERDEDILLAFSECAPGNMTRRFGLFDAHWVLPRHGREPFEDDPERGQTWTAFVPKGAREDAAAMLRELPLDARVRIGERLEPTVVRPDSLAVERGGWFVGNDWQPDWAYDARRRRVVRYAAGGGLPGIHHKSDSQLRGFIVVDADLAMAESRAFAPLEPLVTRLSVFRGAAVRGAQTGLRVSRVFWGVDVRLVVEMGQARRREEEYLSQVFVHPDDRDVLPASNRRAQLHGYQVETEGISLALDRSVLDAFVAAESGRLKDTADGRWLRGQFFRYLITSRGAAAGFNSYELRQVADLMVTAAAAENLRGEVQSLARRWDSARFGALLGTTYEQYLLAHPLLSARRVLKLRDGLVREAAFGDVFRDAYGAVQSDQTFERYLRSVAIHGLAIRLAQLFVLHGRGDERRVLFHAKLPMQFGEEVDDVITIAEDGSHGDGTTRTFLARFEEAIEDFRSRTLGGCPSAEEDRLIDLLDAHVADIERWRAWDPGHEGTVRRLASELGIDPDLSPSAFQGVLRLVYGTEEVGSERFDLYALHAELRALRALLEGRIRREPSAWELVSLVVGRATQADPTIPQWSRLLAAYRTIQHAVQVESLSSEARLADQAYRLSARLCIDGCQACLHTGSTLMPDAMAEVAVSRRVLESLSAFLTGRSPAR